MNTQKGVTWSRRTFNTYLMKFPLVSKEAKKQASKVSRVVRERTVKNNPHVILLTANRAGLKYKSGDVAKKLALSIEQREHNMRVAWVRCLVDHLRNVQWFEEEKKLKWEEIEDAFVKRRQTWEKALSSQWVEEERDRWFTNAKGQKMKKKYLYKGPSYPITDHFIHDVTTYMAQEGFNIATREFVDMLAQGLWIQPDHNAEFFSDPENPAYLKMDKEEAKSMLKKAQEAMDNHEVEYVGQWQNPKDPDDFDVEWFERFPLVSFGNDKESIYKHNDHVDEWSMEFEEFVFPEEAEKKGRVHKRVRLRTSKRLRREEEFNQAVTERKELVEEKPKVTKQQQEVEEYLGAAKGWLEVLDVRQPIHPNMLDKDGRFTMTVSVQYMNVGTEEAPQWVKTSHTVEGSPIQTGHRS